MFKAIKTAPTVFNNKNTRDQKIIMEYVQDIESMEGFFGRVKKKVYKFFNPTRTTYDSYRNDLDTTIAE